MCIEESPGQIALVYLSELKFVCSCHFEVILIAFCPLCESSNKRHSIVLPEDMCSNMVEQLWTLPKFNFDLVIISLEIVERG